MRTSLPSAIANLTLDAVATPGASITKDIRERPTALLPDPAADVRSFRLTLCSPLGTKRNGLRNGFIPSVNAAVDAFYAEVVQGLKPSVAPKLPAEVAEESIAAIG